MVAFIRGLTADDEAIGGKARSLARLAALGLPVPAGFAVAVTLDETLRAAGRPALPARLESAGELAALEAARQAVERTAFPPAFEDQLHDALTALAGPDDAPDHAPDAQSRPRRPTEFAVRSSAATEDRPGALGAGVFTSVMRVPRVGVADAIRKVLASYLTPAAWVYTRRSGAGDPTLSPGGAVLVHLFVDGEAGGTAAFDPAPAHAAARLREPDDANFRLEASWGTPTDGARAAIRAAALAAAAVHGAVELEWVALGDNVTFLQLRGYRRAPDAAAPVAAARAPRVNAGSQAAVFSAAIEPRQPGGAWTWDAAHNPLPLSPAQAGLVDLVDARCRIGIRQQVLAGFLFYRPEADATPSAADGLTAGGGDSGDARRGAEARATFERTRADLSCRIDALGAGPSLAAALDVYVAGYQPLFGEVGPACAAARAALAEFVARWFPERPDAFRRLLADVPSVATRRRAAARDIAAAEDPADRQQAIDAYLRAFGDESPRWDVAEPTLREAPAPLLLLGALPGAGTAAPTPAPARDGHAVTPAATSDQALAELRSALPPTQQDRLEALVQDARLAVAVGEDDDALFARLQATVRAALRALGQRLVRGGQLDRADDVFFLPLSIAFSLDQQPAAPGAPAPPASGGDALASVPRAVSGLREIVAHAREAFQVAAAAPPGLRPDPTARIVRGLAGSGGRVVGRVVHHPPTAPLTADSVLVAPTLLPTELPLLEPGAIVTEAGSILDHVAAQARERGIPAVVGAHGARAALAEGARVIVDGDRGHVILIDEG